MEEGKGRKSLKGDERNLFIYFIRHVAEACDR